MPFGAKPVCFNCKADTSAIWQKTSGGEILCNTCYQDPNNSNHKNGNNSNGENGKGNGNGNSGGAGSHFVGAVRKSARLKPSKYRFQATTKHFATKGKSRRIIFKKNTIKAPCNVSTVSTSDYLFYDGMYYQIGDVVSVMDHDGGIFYAQIRGFMVDQFMNKSAVITWLIPTMSSPVEGFDPATYILGPEEDLPRRMECFEFVCHAPSEYYKAKKAPYSTLPAKPELGFIWTGIGNPEIRPVPSSDEIYGLRQPKDEARDRSRAREKDPEKEREKRDRKEREKRELKERREREKQVPRESQRVTRDSQRVAREREKLVKEIKVEKK